MNSQEMTLSSAIEILEITDLSKIDISELSTIRRRAKKRWHPDRISYANPGEETIKRFERNFSLVDKAIELVNDYLGGETPVSAKVAAGYNRSQQSERPEDFARRNAGEFQQMVRNVWARVKEQSYKLKEEVVILAEGHKISDLLMEDLKDNIPVIAFVSLYNGIIVFTLIILIMVLVLSGISNKMIVTIILYVLTFAWIAQALSCVVMFLPLSRFWVPEKVESFVMGLTNIGLSVNRVIEENRWDENLVVAVIFGLPVRLAQISKWIILYPLYKLAGLLLGDRRIGRVQVKIKYYAGLSEDYIEELIYSDPNAFMQDQLFDLAYIAGEFKEI